MAKVFRTCFAPSKALSWDELAKPLATDVECLRRWLDDNPPPLQWCIEAVFLIKKIHSRLLLYLDTSQVPTSCWEGMCVLDAYMRVTLDLLDFCNSLKSTISSLDRHRMMVDFTIKDLENASNSTMAGKIEFARPKGGSCIFNKLADTNKWGVINLHKERISKVKLKTRSDSMQIVHVIGNTMSIISLLVSCSILHPTPIKIDETLCSQLPISDSLSNSIKELVASFVERYKCVENTGKAVLYENETIEDALSACQSQVVSASVCEATLPEMVNLVRRRSMALKQGLGLFECVVNELFDEVIKGRKQFIGLITSNT